MSKLKIFLSSNQNEFKVERLLIKQFIENTPIYSSLFEVFLFENLPAGGNSPRETYLSEVEKSDIFLGLIGEDYGRVNKNGLSATEEEFNTFQKTSNRKNTFIFIKEGIKKDKKTLKFIEKVHRVTYDKFNQENILIKIQSTLEKFLFDKELIQNKDFDERIVLESDFKDVNQEKVKYFLKIANTSNIGNITTNIKNTLLNRLHVLNNEKHLTNTGILFFSNNPSIFISQNEIRMASFKTNEKVDIIDKNYINTTICQALKEVEIFFHRNTRIGSEIKGFRRKDIPEYPYEAIREAVVNAIAHRDYTIRTSPITFFIFPDRIEITSPGELPNPLTIEDLGEKTAHRNKKICELLQMTSYMEIIGSGIPRMRAKMRKQDLPEPEFVQSPGFFTVIFRNSKRIDLDTSKLNKRQQKIVNFLKDEGGSININSVMDVFEVSKPTASRDLKELTEEKYLKKIPVNKKQNKYILNPKSYE